MLESEEGWKAISEYVAGVMRVKEDAERARQRQLPPPIPPHRTPEESPICRSRAPGQRRVPAGGGERV